MNNEPEIKVIPYGDRELTVVRVSSVPGFGEWLGGCTMPVIEGDADPFGWAYIWDYDDFMRGYPHSPD